MLHKLIATLRKRGTQGRSFPVQAAEATQAAEIISDLLRQRDALLEALQDSMKLIDLAIPYEGDITRKARAAIAAATGEDAA